MPKLPTVLFLISTSIFVIVHIISLELSLYWTHLWLDIPMHALGGAVIVLGFFTVHDLYPKYPARLLLPIPILLLVLLVSLGWEVYELQLGLMVEENYRVDTIADIIMSMLGGVVGYVVAYSVSSIEFDEEIA